MSNTLTTTYDLERFIGACVRYANEATEYNFRVEFHDPRDRGPKYYTYRKGKNITVHIPSPTTATSERDAKIIKAGLIHEMTHTAEGTHDALDLIKESGIGELKDSDPLAMIWQTVEDHRIERRDCAKFEGDARVLRDAYEILSKEFTDKVRKGEIDLEKAGDAAKKLMALNLLDYKAREQWMNLDQVTDEEFEVAPKQVQELAKKLIEEDFDTELHSINTVPESLEFAKKIFERLFDKNADEHCQEQKQKQKQEQEEEEKEDKKQKKSQGTQTQQGEGDGSSTEVDHPSEGEVDYLKYVLNKKGIPEGGAKGSGSGAHIDYQSYLESADEIPDFQGTPLNEMGVMDFGTGTVQEFGEGYIGPPMRELVSGEERYFGSVGISNTFRNHSTSITAFANKVRRLLQVHSQARYRGGATSGRMHRKNAYRAGLPTMGDGRWNREIFKRRHQDATLDVAVSVLCDFSGSMSGAKAAHAAFGGFLLCDAIGRVLRVPVQVQTFSECDCYTAICILKNWNEFVTEQEFIERSERAVGTMEQNDDGSAILWAYNNLLQRREKRKVLIVLSDGSPASSRSGDEMKYTKQIVGDIEKEKSVDIYGIGIMDKNVDLIYKERETINKASDIEKAILNTVKRKLIV